MDIKLFSLCKQEDPAIESGKKHLLECVKSFFPDCEGILPFTSQKRMLLAAAQSLRGADVVIIAVQNNMYNATKRLLAESLGIKKMKNKTVYNALQPLLEADKLKESVFNANIIFPQGAVILPTENMLNCGFILTAGSQSIIYLPIENPYADEVIYGSLYDYLATLCDENVARKGIESRHRAIIKRTADKLDENSIKIAFSDSPPAELVQKISETISSKHCFSFKTYDQYNDVEAINMIDEARLLKNEQFAQFGVNFSDILNLPTGEKYIRVTIADETGTNDFKFFALENESDSDLIANSVDKIMLTLYNFENLAEPDNPAEIPTKADKKLRKSLLYLSAGAVGASAIVGLIISALV